MQEALLPAAPVPPAFPPQPRASSSELEIRNFADQLLGPNCRPTAKASASFSSLPFVGLLFSSVCWTATGLPSLPMQHTT